MRVALIAETFLPAVNGVVTTLCQMLEHLRRRGHETLLLAPHTSPESYVGVEIVPLYGVAFPFYPEMRVTPPQLGLTARLRRFDPELLHMVGPVVFGGSARRAARRLDRPLISSYHTDLPAYSAHYGFGFLRGALYHYLRSFHNRCALTLCPSTATLADLRAHGFRRLRLWRRGVDTTRFHPSYRSEVWRRAIGVRPGEILLLYAGRLASEKRLDLLAEALEGLEGVRLALVGDGPLRRSLQRRLAGAPAHFTGYLRGDALATAYASADLFVFPSASETFGQVIQEAMSSGLPVVAARAGGALDLIDEGVTGVLFAPGSAADLRERIRQLIADPSFRASLGRAGRAVAERRSWDSAIDELLEYYRYVQRQWARARRRAAYREAVRRSDRSRAACRL